jgi:hypothetical protein
MSELLFFLTIVFFWVTVGLRLFDIEALSIHFIPLSKLPIYESLPISMLNQLK